MKPKHTMSVALAAVAVLASSSLVKAQLVFDVNINTAALITEASPLGDGPFYLDFQLNPGSTTIGNTATISNVVAIGGTLTGSPTDRSETGASTSDSNGVIQLKDYTPAHLGQYGITTGFTVGNAEIYQELSPTVADISFQVTLTSNSTGTTPDEFDVAILNSLDPSSPYQIDTSAPDTLNLVEAQLGFANNGPRTTTNNVQGTTARTCLVRAAMTTVA